MVQSIHITRAELRASITCAAFATAMGCVFASTASASSGGTTPVLVRQEAEFFPASSAGSAGRVLSISGNTLAVGSGPGNGGTGEVFIYDRVNGVWGSPITLLASDGLSGDGFGSWLALSGDWLAIGAPSRSEPPFSHVGAVYVFTRIAGVWSETAKLVSPNPDNDIGFGGVVTLDGDTLAVLRSQSTRIYIYVRSGTSWTQQAELTEPNWYSSDNDFGSSMCLRGDTLIAGDPTYQWGGGERGKAWAFVRNTGVWTLQQELVGGDTHNNDKFGYSVALDGDRALVGALHHTVRGKTQSGAVYAFQRAGTAWRTMQEFIGHDTLGGDQFGASVALQGSRAIVGALRIGATGVAYGFGLSNTFEWNEIVSLVPPDGVLFGNYGFRVALDGDLFAVNANHETGEPVYAYSITDVPTAIYCTAKVNSAGCTPQIAASGFASMSDLTPFTISASQIVNQKSGIFFYGTHGRLGAPFQGGTLCVTPPLKRTPVQSSGGNPPPEDCSGVLSIDFNAWLQSGFDKSLAPGVALDGQFWNRDPNSPSTTGLSDAIEFGIVY